MTRPWLDNPKTRAEFAEILDCTECEVEAILDARDAEIAARENPNGMVWPDDEDEPVRPAGELPVSVEIKWFHGWDKGAGTDFHDYCYRVTWADGSAEMRHTVPNAWHTNIAENTSKLNENRSDTARIGAMT